MIGPILTFVLVCAIVAIYMTIVHSFLRASEEPPDTARHEKARPAAKPHQDDEEEFHRAEWAR